MLGMRRRKRVTERCQKVFHDLADDASDSAWIATRTIVWWLRRSARTETKQTHNDQSSDELTHEPSSKRPALRIGERAPSLKE